MTANKQFDLLHVFKHMMAHKENECFLVRKGFFSIQKEEKKIFLTERKNPDWIWELCVISHIFSSS